MGANTEITNVEVQSNGQNNVESSNKTVAEKSKSNKEQAEENKQVKTNTINNKTEEATIMEGHTEKIGIEYQSGLLNHVIGFYESGATASKRVEEQEFNKVVNSKSMFGKEAGNEEKVTNMKNSEEKGCTVDKEQAIGVEKPMEDKWGFDDLEEDDTMDSKQGKTEKLVDDDERHATWRLTNTQIGTQEKWKKKMVKKSRHHANKTQRKIDG